MGQANVYKSVTIGGKDLIFIPKVHNDKAINVCTKFELDPIFKVIMIIDSFHIQNF